MRIIVDQDQVICKWVERILEWFNNDYGTSFTRDDVKNYWGMESILGSQGKPFIRACIRYPELYRDLDPVEGAIEGMKRLIDDGHDVIIATAVPSAGGIAYHGKLEWIRRNMPFFNLKNFVAIQRKSLLSGDVLVDDGPHNITEWLATNRNAIVFDCPWNRSLADEALLRSHSWDDVVRHVQLLDRIFKENVHMTST